MFVDDIEQLPKNQRLLGLDLGEKTIGVAISDISQTIATPVEIIKRRKFGQDAARLFEIIDDRGGVGAIIIGMPFNMDGSENTKCQSNRQFGRNLAKLRELPVLFQDERLSTVAAANIMNEAAMTHTRQKELIDKLAACYILQSTLDRR